MNETVRQLEIALAQTERMWREEKRKKEYYRQLSFERWAKLQEVRFDSCRN